MFVFWKKILPFWTFTDKYQAFCRIVFRLDRQNCFLRVQRRVLRKNIFLKSTVFHPFRTVSWNVSAFFGKFQRGCQNNILRVHRNILMNKFFLNKNLSFSAFNEKTVAFYWTFFGSVFKNVFSLPIWKSWRNSTLWEKNSSLSKHWVPSLRFGLLSKKIWGCQNNILPVHGNILMKCFFWKKVF